MNGTQCTFHNWHDHFIKVGLPGYNMYYYTISESHYTLCTCIIFAIRINEGN